MKGKKESAISNFRLHCGVQGQGGLIVCSAVKIVSFPPFSTYALLNYVIPSKTVEYHRKLAI